MSYQLYVLLVQVFVTLQAVLGAHITLQSSRRHSPNLQGTLSLTLAHLQPQAVTAWWTLVRLVERWHLTVYGTCVAVQVLYESMPGMCTPTSLLQCLAVTLVQTRMA